MTHFVYILFSQKLDSYYIGETSELEIRLKWHNEKTFVKAYTKTTDDWSFVYQINGFDIFQARKIEKHIKSMKSKIYIENLIVYPQMTIKLLEKYKSDL